MRVGLVHIGNSRGIRIPKALIDQCGFGETVNLRVERDHLIIAPDRPVRDGWAEAFRRAGTGANDEMLLDTTPNQFDREEWEW
jgi:antitoxin MazE